MILHSDWLADWIRSHLEAAGFEDDVVWPTIWAVDYNAGSEWDWTEEQDGQD